MGLTTREEESIKEFDQWAHNFEKSIKLPYFNYTYRKVFSLTRDYIKKGSNILDIGCGTGKFEHLLAENSPLDKIIGLDISGEMIKKAKGRPNQKIEFIEGSIASYELDQTYDLVYSLQAFHHFPDYENTVQIIYQLLNNGGKFIFLDHVNGMFTRKIACALLKIIFSEPEVEYYTIKQLINLFEKTGFKVKSQTSLPLFLYYMVFEK